MTTDESYSTEALQAFLKQAGMEGAINPAAARSRRNALVQLEAELTDDERRDVRNLDVDQLVSRFHKLEGSSIRPESLQLYANRLRTALADFLAWKQDPASFVGSAQERSRAFSRGANRQAALSPDQEAAERIVLEATENPTNVVPVPVREDTTVYVANLPLDLTAEEADRIARIVRAFARPDNDDPESNP